VLRREEERRVAAGRGFLGVFAVVRTRLMPAMMVTAAVSLGDWMEGERMPLLVCRLFRPLRSVLACAVESNLVRAVLKLGASFHPARPPRYGAPNKPTPQNTKQSSSLPGQQPPTYTTARTVYSHNGQDRIYILQNILH
jgi:hypothetical protein